MKRPLRPSEKILLTACLTLVGGLGLAFLVRDHRLRTNTARQRLETLKPQQLASSASLSDAPFWDERRVWLAATMPKMTDPGTAHSQFLEELRQSARERGLTLGRPVLLKPESNPHFHDLAVTLQITGPDQSVYRWLVELQSPEKFHRIKYLLLTTERGPGPRMTGTVTISRLFQP